MKRVLVTDGEQRAALAIVRSLGRQGFAPYVCSARPPSLSGASRFAVEEAPVPPALTAPSVFVHEVRELVRRWSIDVLIPVSEPALLAVLEARESLGDVLIPFPDIHAVRLVNDKRLLMDRAREVGLSVPGQAVLEQPGEIGRIPSPLRDGSVVIKPSRSVAEVDGRRYKLGVEYAADRPELERRVSALPRAAFPVLLQQRVVGPGVGVFLLIWNGETRAIFSHRRLREKPPSGGVSVYRESIPADPDLVQKSRALLDRYHWNGVAMVEYKVDSSSGEAYLMEVNGRFWGSLQLAIDAGVDFPTLLLDAAMGGSVRVDDYRLGIRSRWWWGDIDQLITRLRRSRAELALPPDAGSLGRALLDFSVMWRPGDRSEVFRWSDPAPFARESVDWIARR